MYMFFSELHRVCPIFFLYGKNFNLKTCRLQIKSVFLNSQTSPMPLAQKRKPLVARPASGPRPQAWLRRRATWWGAQEKSLK